MCIIFKKMHVNLTQFCFGICLIEIFIYLLKMYICIKMFIIALFALGKKLKQPKWLYNTVCYSFYCFGTELGANCYLVLIWNSFCSN